MTDVHTPSVAPGEREFAELRQITVKADEEISQVNGLLSDGWRLVSIGYRADATIYVLGHKEQRPRHRAGFVFGEEQG